MSGRGTCNFQADSGRDPGIPGYFPGVGGAIFANDGANVEIHDTIFLTNSATGSVSISTHYFPRIISKFRSNSRRATYNFQGGAIAAGNGAIVEIHTSSFISNAAGQVCSMIFVPRNFLKFLYVPAVDMKLPSTYHRSFFVARIGGSHGISCQTWTYR